MAGRRPVVAHQGSVVEHENAVEIGQQVQVMGQQDDLLAQPRPPSWPPPRRCEGRAAWWARRGPAWPARSPAPRPGRAAASARRRAGGPGGRHGRPARTGSARPITRSLSSARLRPRRRRLKATSSATVGITICASGLVKQKPTRRRTAGPSRRVSCPATRTTPWSGTTSPFSSRAKVDLPEPFAPMTPTRCSAKVTSTARSTVRRAAPSPYAWDTPDTSISGMLPPPSPHPVRRRPRWPPDRSGRPAGGRAG